MFVRLEQIAISFLIVVWVRVGSPSHPQAFANAQACIGTVDNRYICTDNSAKAHTHASGRHSISHVKHLGIEQSIIGSDKEIEGIKEIIMKMEEYIMNEVLAKPEYARVRDTW